MILQKIPSYLCNATGLVRLNIKVNSKGFVTDCRIDNIKTTTNDACLIKNALNYASNWSCLESENLKKYSDQKL